MNPGWGFILHPQELSGRDCDRGFHLCYRLRFLFGADHAERLFFVFKKRAAAGGARLFKHLPAFEEILRHDLIIFLFGHTSPSG